MHAPLRRVCNAAASSAGTPAQFVIFLCRSQSTAPAKAMALATEAAPGKGKFGQLIPWGDPVRAWPRPYRLLALAACG